MPEHLEYFEKPAPPKSDASLHRSFRPVDGPPPEYEQVIGAKENEAFRAGDWVDRGIQNVPLAKIDLSDSPVRDANDFCKVSHDEMVRSVQRLESEVRPAVERGATLDDFRKMDQVRGVNYPIDSSLRVYEAFYAEPIQLDKIGDRYVVGDGGYHRLFVARELELSTIPARVKELRA